MFIASHKQSAASQFSIIDFRFSIGLNQAGSSVAVVVRVTLRRSVTVKV